MVCYLRLLLNILVLLEGHIRLELVYLTHTTILDVQVIINVLQVYNLVTMNTILLLQFFDVLLQVSLLDRLLLNGRVTRFQLALQAFDLGNQVADLIFEDGAHLIMQLLLILNLPLEIFNLETVLFQVR